MIENLQDEDWLSLVEWRNRRWRRVALEIFRDLLTDPD